MYKDALIGGLALLALAGCSGSPDLSAVKAEQAKAVRRYDVAQALAGNGRVIVAATQTGAMLVSADLGKTWAREPIAGASVIGLAVCPDGSFIGIDFYRKLWTGDAAGGHWQARALDKPRTPLAVACDARGRWWVAGTRATLAVSADQGQHWQITDLGQDLQFTALEFIDDRNGIAAGEFGTVVATRDGGASWSARGKMPGDFYPYAMVFRDAREGWASGIAGQMLHTTDGGATWTRMAHAAPAPLYRLFLHDGAPYGVGAGGVVERLAGDAWQAVPYPDASPAFLGAGASLAAQHAIVAGGPGGLLRVIGTQVH